jgi:hypothetical protein
MNEWNAFQTISVTGLIFSAVTQIILIVIGKHVDSMWALYPTWGFVFLFGYLLKKFTKEDHHHSH